MLIAGTGAVSAAPSCPLTEAALDAGAVRSPGPTHLDEPFSTTLAGQDVAKLMQGGYMTAAIVVAIAAGMRHNDPATVRARRPLSGNAEIPALTELVNAVRGEAGRELRLRLEKSGADGAILAAELRSGGARTRVRLRRRGQDRRYCGSSLRSTHIPKVVPLPRLPLLWSRSRV